jgi:hypothetical protein
MGQNLPTVGTSSSYEIDQMQYFEHTDKEKRIYISLMIRMKGMAEFLRVGRTENLGLEFSYYEGKRWRK